MKNLTTISLQPKRLQYNDIIHHFFGGVAEMKKTIINLLKWIGMILTLITMIVVVLYCVLFNFVDSPNLEKQMHEQYLSGKSEQYMNQISQQEKEAKLKQEYGLMWMNHVNKK